MSSKKRIRGNKRRGKKHDEHKEETENKEKETD
jgi:hypothetical protein